MKEDRRNDGASPPSPRRPGEKPFVPFVAFEDVVVRCGHVEKFGIMPDGKDRFREDRRKKVMSRDCKACREKKQQQEQEAAEQRRCEKEKRKLPDGSRFEVRYDAEKEQWSGSLTVPSPEGAPATFTGLGSGLFPLLTSLDKQYRATLTSAAKAGISARSSGP
jgi:hypothetical protein